MSGRIRSRRGNGQFRRASIENTFGLRAIVCAECRGFDAHELSEPCPATCSHCGKPLVSLYAAQPPAPAPRGEAGEKGE